jgi:glycosyltransferase involved in cell wall biosynthesis
MMTQHTSPPRRVAFVLGQRGGGGTETQSQLLVRGLCSRGVDVDVYVVEGDCDPPCMDFGAAPVTTLSAGRSRGVREALRTCLAGARLGAALRRRRYDVVHAALARAYVIAPLVAPLRHRPRIVGWRRNLGLHLRGAASTAADRAAARLCDVIVANSEPVRRYWVDRGWVPAARTRVIPNALEPWRFDRVSAAPVDLARTHDAVRHDALLRDAVRPEAVRLVSVGGLHAVKGHRVLLDAAAMVHRAGIPVEVVILGEGPLREALREQAQRLGVWLHLPGHQRDTRPWLASSTMYVHSSLSEGASNAVAEAMAQGCAVVATDVGGTAEMLGAGAVASAQMLGAGGVVSAQMPGRDGAVAGRLVAPGDAAALAAAIAVLSADRRLREELAGATRARARQLFDLDRVIDDHLDVYAGS